MSRKEERARLMAFLEANLPFSTRLDRVRLTTAMLDGGYRYNPTVLREAADAFESGPVDRLHTPTHRLRQRARTMEDTLPEY